MVEMIGGSIVDEMEKDNYFILNILHSLDYLFISSQMSAKPYFIGSTGILLLW